MLARTAFVEMQDWVNCPARAQRDCLILEKIRNVAPLPCSPQSKPVFKGDGGSLKLWVWSRSG